MKRQPVALRYVALGFMLLAASAAAGAPVKISERFGFDPEDSTKFIQQALDSGLPEIMLDDKGSPWITRPLAGRSNQTLYFADGVVLLAKKGEFRGRGDALLCYRHATGIAVVGMGRRGGTIRMRKADYLQPPYERAEWRHAIHIGNTSSFRIENMLLTESGGDGIEIYGTACSNGVIRKVTCDANCRQGVSVCSARHLLIEDCVLKNTEGTPPEAGIDFEPDKNDHMLSDIVMRNCRVTGNAGNGIEFFTGCSCSKTEPFSVTVADCTVVSNNISARIGGGAWKKDNYPQGRITYTNCLFEASRRYAVSVDAKPAEAYVVEFLGCTAKDTAEGTDVRLLDHAKNGVRTGGVVFRCCNFHSTFVSDVQEESGFSKEDFCNPPPEFSPSFFWLWGGTLTKDGVLAEFDDMAAHGARTACIHPYPKAFRWFVESPMVPDYLTDGYFDLYGAVLDHIEQSGGRSWLYDEGGWPSGSACGRVVASDPERFKPRYVTAGGVVESDMGDPKWGALCPSLIERGATERFIELGYEPYRKRFARHFGKTVRFAFTDEPGYPNVRKGGRLPWCTDFADEFRARKHYDILPFVDDLVAPSNCTEEVVRVRIDYYDVLSSMLCERYFLKVRDWCRTNGLGFGGHLNGEDDPIYNAEGNYGHALRCLRTMDVPGVDVIWRQLFPGKNGRQMPFTKYASSAAHQAGGRYVLSESCAIYGDGLTPAQMKWLADYQSLRGANLFVFSSYQPHPSRNMMGGGGPHFGPSDPQWDYMTTFFEALSRQCALLAQGKPCVRTAVLYDIRGIWAGGDEAQETIARHVSVARKLMEEQRDFDFVDDDQLAVAALREDGTLEIGKMRYSAVVLPTSRRMLPAARRKLADFASRGGVLAEVDNFSAVPKTCFVEGDGAPDIRAAKRTCGGQALYFLVNESEEPRRVHVRFDEAAPLVRADAETGRFVEWPSENGAFMWDAAGCGSLLLVSGAAAGDPAPQKPAGAELVLRDGWTMAVRRRMKVGTFAYETADYPDAPSFAASLGDWRKTLGDEFSGRVLYRIAFDSPEAGEAELDLGEVHNCCAVRLNGRDVGARYAGPYMWRVTIAKGSNELEVTVANAIVNAVSPARVRDYIYRTFPPESPYEARVRAFNEGGHESGLYGPVRIRFVGRTTVSSYASHL